MPVDQRFHRLQFEQRSADENQIQIVCLTEALVRNLNRHLDARIEVPIEVSYESFCKTYYLDLVFVGGALFELKAVEALVNRHRAQLLHYLLLADLLHGKLVNMRLEAVAGAAPPAS